MSSVDRLRAKLPRVVQNGVLLNYASSRFQEAKNELDKFISGPVNYVLTEQRLRKVVLLELLDYARPVVGTRWEHKLVPK